MKIEDILRNKGRNVFSIAPGETVHAAIRQLNEHGIGALIVRGEDGDPVGIITERDVLRTCGEHCSHLLDSAEAGAKDCPALVSNVMSTELIVGVPGDDVEYVMGVMTNNRVRHLPVMDGGVLVGVISIGDVVNAFVEETEIENRLLKDYIHGPGRPGST
jgi:CBS domain-containing protein